MSPYITGNTLVEKLKSSNIDKIKILTGSCSIQDFAFGSSELKLLKELIHYKNIEIRYFSNLHAKVYMFDNDKVPVTSANLTLSGLEKNLEYGVLIDHEGVNMVDDLNSLWEKAMVFTPILLREIEGKLLTLTEKIEKYKNIKNAIKLETDSTIKRHFSRQIINHNKDMLTENEALDKVFNRWNYREEEKIKLESVYELIKSNVPVNIREKCSFRYSTGNKDNIACNINNYRLFLFLKKRQIN